MLALETSASWPPAMVTALDLVLESPEVEIGFTSRRDRVGDRRIWIHSDGPLVAAERDADQRFVIDEPAPQEADRMRDVVRANVNDEPIKNRPMGRELRGRWLHALFVGAQRRPHWLDLLVDLMEVSWPCPMVQPIVYDWRIKRPPLVWDTREVRALRSFVSTT